MVSVPHEIMTGFVALLSIRGIPQGQAEYYKKWLRYFYDFSANYLQEQERVAKVRLFLDKLKSKGQSSAQCQQAAHAVALYFELLDQNLESTSSGNETVLTEASSQLSKPVPSASVQSEQLLHSEDLGRLRPSQYFVAGYQEKSDSPEWDEVLGKLADEIKVRHGVRWTWIERWMSRSRMIIEMQKKGCRIGSPFYVAG